MPRGATTLELRDVVAPARGGVWAMGVWWGGMPSHVFARFDGAGWALIPAPETATQQYDLDLVSIDATAGGDLWTVGGNWASGAASTAAVLRYNGSWSIEPTPSAPDTTSTLNGIDMLSDDDGWAVGRITAGTGPARAMILRWQAGKWMSSAAPDTGAVHAELHSVRALSSTDAWAVGSQTSADGRSMGLVLHWDGLEWQHMPVPDAGTGDQTLTAVDVTAPANVWAVGRTCQVSPPAAPSCGTRVLRLAGDEWDVVPTVGGTELIDVIAFSSTDVWVFGYAKNALQSETEHIEHWNGTRFETETGVSAIGINGSEPSSALTAASASSPQELWAIGWAGGTLGPVGYTMRRL